MIVKSIDNTIGYKGLRDGFRVKFDEEITYIVGDNFKTKSTILSVPLWVLTGYNMTGSNQEELIDDKRKYIKNVIAEITIIDNDGIEHTITRSKGKNNVVLLDGVRTSKEMLAKFYKDIQFFLCSYNPYRFNSLEHSKQKEILLRLLPPISKEDALNLISKEEQEIIQEPILDNTGYSKSRREKIKELKYEITRYEGIKEGLIPTALVSEEEFKTFSKQDELNMLESEYEKILQGKNDLLNIDDIKEKIKKLYDKINQIITVELMNAKERKLKVEEKLNNSHICYTCKQEIKNQKMIENIERLDRIELQNLKDKIINMKLNAKSYLEEINNLKETYNKLDTVKNKKLISKRNEIKKKIELLKIEKNEIDVFNKTVETKKQSIQEAKKQINFAESKITEIQKQIQLLEKQIKISDKMKKMIIEEQIKNSKDLLKEVSIEFSKVDYDTGEIIDNYQITYKGREYDKLSQSEKMRADFEISNFINKKSGINTAMFIDDAERIRDIEVQKDTQVVVAIYIKYSELEVLYKYNEVLKKKKKSIEQQLVQDNYFVYLNAA